MIKNIIHSIIYTLNIVFFLIGFINFLNAIIYAKNRYTVFDFCDSETTRLGYLFKHGKELGCWLGEVPNDPRNEIKKSNIMKHTRN